MGSVNGGNRPPAVTASSQLIAVLTVTLFTCIDQAVSRSWSLTGQHADASTVHSGRERAGHMTSGQDIGLASWTWTEARRTHHLGLQQVRILSTLYGRNDRMPLHFMTFHADKFTFRRTVLC